MGESLQKEYQALLARKLELEGAAAALPKGSLCLKTIRGRQYWYLQFREGGKVCSRYVREKEREALAEKIQLRKSYKAELPQVRRRLAKLEQAAHLIGGELERGFWLLKISAGMDHVEKAQKEQMVSFADAMNAIEGVAVSKETAQALAQWKNGEKSYISVFKATLARYGFPEVL